MASFDPVAQVADDQLLIVPGDDGAEDGRVFTFAGAAAAIDVQRLREDFEHIGMFFSKNFDRGQGLREAVLEAARQRLRPIIMTSLAFMFGVLPLAIASGAGSGAQNAVGTGVIGGMLAATFLAIVYVPVFFVLILGLFKARPRQAETRTDVQPGPTAEVRP